MSPIYCLVSDVVRIGIKQAFQKVEVWNKSLGNKECGTKRSRRVLVY